MKQIAVIDSIKSEKNWKKITSADFMFEIAETASEFADSSLFDAVIVNADFAGGNIRNTIREAKNNFSLKNKPMAVLTTVCDYEKQNSLCSCGADDIIMLPICSELFINRIRMLIAAFPELQKNKDIFLDFDEIMSYVGEKHSASKGAMCVPKNEFANICNFVLRGLERNRKKAQVLLFTLKRVSENDENEGFGEIMSILSSAVQQCLRKGDTTSVCSENQILVLITGADDEGGHLVANRIVSSFYCEYDSGCFELQYDIREINADNNSNPLENTLNTLHSNVKH